MHDGIQDLLQGPQGSSEANFKIIFKADFSPFLSISGFDVVVIIMVFKHCTKLKSSRRKCHFLLSVLPGQKSVIYAAGFLLVIICSFLSALTLEESFF